MTKIAEDMTLKRNLAEPNYHPTKAEMEIDVSIPTTPERLAAAVLKGGAERREPDD